MSRPWRLTRKESDSCFAAIALYRALLGSCRASQLDSGRSTDLRHVIQSRFRTNKELQSPTLLARAFNAGYEVRTSGPKAVLLTHSVPLQTLDLLDKSVANDASSTSHIIGLLDATPPAWRKPPMKAKERRKKPARVPEPSEKILARPRPLNSLTGPRHIPTLVNASRIPFLRIKSRNRESSPPYFGIESRSGQAPS